MTDTTLNRYLGRGDTAAMNAHIPDPATPASGPDPGYFWFNTDDNIVYSYDFVGMAWVPPAGTGTVTDFLFTDGNALVGSVATSTTTPTLSINPTSLNHAAFGGI